MVRLSAFADEVTDDFSGQIRFLAEEKVSFIEPRFVNGKNIVDLQKDDLLEIKKIMEDYGIGVSAIGSPIGKIRLDESFSPHLDKFKRVVETAIFLGTPFIRVFSYYAPNGKEIKDFGPEVVDRILKKIEVIENTDLIMLHENEHNTFGQTPQGCEYLVKTVDSSKFKLVYDPANFTSNLNMFNNMEICWPMLKQYVCHVHIKDWKVGADMGSMPGEGDAHIPELLSELASLKYDGFITMEPHLQKGGQFCGKTGAKLFSAAIKATRTIARCSGLKCD